MRATQMKTPELKTQVNETIVPRLLASMCISGRVLHRILLFTALLLGGMQAQAGNPYLVFSDLISGPSTGLGDGMGSGAVVTLWGQFLGDNDGTGKVTMVDVNANEHEAHVYYWKFADGVLPSGPANLHASHYMHEIAFSVPEIPSGAAEIYVTVNGMESNRLPFLVRDGQIHHVKSSGNDSNGNGLWANPWATVNRALKEAPAGSTIYVHDVDTGDATTTRAVYWNETDSSSTLDAQLSIVAFPGFQPKVLGQQGVENYTTEGMVVSKLDIYSSNYTEEDSNGQFVPESRISSSETFGIRSTRNGRAISNRITDLPGGCASSFAGAISGGRDRVSNFKALGNEIYDYGCPGTTKFHHTTYLTVRSGTGLQVEAWEWGYNYLHGNHAKFGIHNYDENENCGDLIGVLRIHNNVIVDQGGAGISVGSNCGWSMDVEIENNVLINVGLAAAWDGIDINTADGHEGGGIAIRDAGPHGGLSSTIQIRNNTVYGYSADGHPGENNGCLAINGGNSDVVAIDWSRNVCVTNINQPFVGFTNASSAKNDNITGQENVWYSSVDGPTVPFWEASSHTYNPELIVDNSKIIMADESELRNNLKATLDLIHDIYGRQRGVESAVGAVQFNTTRLSAPVDVNYSLE